MDSLLAAILYQEIMIGTTSSGISYQLRDIYNIGVLTVNIEFICRGLETGKDELLASLSNRFVTSHINPIFTINTPILYLSCNKICNKKKVIYIPYTEKIPDTC